MQEIIDSLYRYAQEMRVRKYLRTSKYIQTTHGMEEGWDDFRITLTAEQNQRLDALLLQEAEINQLEGKAVFQAGISIGLALGRL